MKASEYYRNRKLSYQELVTFSSARSALPLRLRAPWAAGETAHRRVCAAARVLSPASAVQKRMTSQFGDRAPMRLTICSTSRCAGACACVVGSRVTVPAPAERRAGAEMDRRIPHFGLSGAVAPLPRRESFRFRRFEALKASESFRKLGKLSEICGSLLRSRARSSLQLAQIIAQRAASPSSVASALCIFRPRHHEPWRSLGSCGLPYHASPASSGSG